MKNNLDQIEIRTLFIFSEIETLKSARDMRKRFPNEPQEKVAEYQTQIDSKFMELKSIANTLEDSKFKKDLLDKINYFENVRHITGVFP